MTSFEELTFEEAQWWLERTSYNVGEAASCINYLNHPWFTDDREAFAEFQQAEYFRKLRKASNSMKVPIAALVEARDKFLSSHDAAAYYDLPRFTKWFLEQEWIKTFVSFTGATQSVARAAGRKVNFAGTEMELCIDKHLYAGEKQPQERQSAPTTPQCVTEDVPGCTTSAERCSLTDPSPRE